MKEADSGGKDLPVARRLRVLRKAEGDTKPVVWAKRVGWSLSKLSNYENGVPLSKNAAIGLAKLIPGLTTDWLFLGRKEGLSVDLLRRIDAAEAKLRGDECWDADDDDPPSLPERKDISC
jgi:hypothetical protein